MKLLSLPTVSLSVQIRLQYLLIQLFLHQKRLLFLMMLRF